MSDIIEILGEKKFSGSRSSDLKSSIVLEETNQTRYDNNLFYTLSQQTQFINEKNNCNNFRIYGKINPILSLDVNVKTINGFRKVNVNNSIFDINLNNWSIVILKSKQIQNGFDANNNPIYSKGTKKILKYIDNDNTKNLRFNLDLTKGLPARTFKSMVYTENYGLYFPLSHNFTIGDRIKIDSASERKIKSGFYIVEIVDGDRVYINKSPFINNFSDDRAGAVSTSSATNFADVVSANNIAAEQNILNNVLNVRNLTFAQNIDSINNLTIPRPKIAPFIQPEFYVTKIVEQEALEYYVKVLEVIDVIDEVDNCGFSKNFLNRQVKSFFLNRNLNLDGYTNNKGEPLTDIYIGIIKNSPANPNEYLTVESHFSDFIDHVSHDDGLEMINDTRVSLNKKTKVGDTFYYRVCEHTTESLTEVELAPIHHRFIHSNVLFNYNPFYKTNIKLKSPYIEDGDANVTSVPPYAVYSRQKEKYIWRDIFDTGVADEDGNVIDFPYMNNALYVFNQINFFLRSEKSATIPYTLNLNDLNNGDNGGNQENSNVTDILNDMNINEIDPNTKPYNEYKDEKC
jgi:hypothetical protein